MWEVIWPILMAASALSATSATGEFAKQGGKAAFEALRQRLSLGPQALSDTPTAPEGLETKIAAMDGDQVSALRDEVQRLARAVEAAQFVQDAQPDESDHSTPAIVADEILSRFDQHYQNVQGSRATRIESRDGGLTFTNVTSPGATRRTQADGNRVEIGQASAGQSINISQRIGLGVGAIFALILLVSVVLILAGRYGTAPPLVEVTVDSTPTPVVIDQQFFLDWAARERFVGPQREAELLAQIQRTQADLDALRARDPDWGAQIDAATKAFNGANQDQVALAFARLDALIEQAHVDAVAQEAQLRLDRARSKASQARLLYPFTASLAEPLWCSAANLARDNFSYWIECGRRRKAIGNLPAAWNAFDAANRLASSSATDLRNRSISANELGDVYRAQGDLVQALASYSEGLVIARQLLAQDGSNAGWQRDLAVSYWKLAEIDLANAVEHWQAVVDQFESMQAHGILFPTDEPFLDVARRNLAIAKAQE